MQSTTFSELIILHEIVKSVKIISVIYSLFCLFGGMSVIIMKLDVYFHLLKLELVCSFKLHPCHGSSFTSSFTVAEREISSFSLKNS